MSLYMPIIDNIVAQAAMMIAILPRKNEEPLRDFSIITNIRTPRAARLIASEFSVIDLIVSCMLKLLTNMQYYVIKIHISICLARHSRSIVTTHVSHDGNTLLPNFLS